MARVDQTVQNIDRDAGLSPTYAAANADGEAFQNSGREIIHVKKSSAGGATLTIQTPQTIQGLAVAEKTITVPGSGEIFVKPLPPSTFNQNDGKVYLDWSSETDITIAVIRP